MENISLDICITPYRKIHTNGHNVNIKFTDPNVKSKSIKHSEKNTSLKPGLRQIFLRMQKPITITEKMLDLHSSGQHQKINRQAPSQRTYSQYIQLTKDMYPEYIKNIYNSVTKRQFILKLGRWGRFQHYTKIHELHNMTRKKLNILTKGMQITP